MIDWYPQAIKLPFRKAFKPYRAANSPWRGVLHTVEANWYRPSQDDYYGHKFPPHFTVTRTGLVYQHVPLSKAAQALRHPSGTPETNHMHAVQIEIVGYAAKINDMPPQQERALKSLMRWIEEECGVVQKYPSRVAGSYGQARVPGFRFTGTQWTAWGGWIGHQHVPNQYPTWHWDPGAIDISRLFTEDPVVEDEDMLKPSNEFNQDVMAFQKQLREWAAVRNIRNEAFNIDVDGKYGPQTTRAVKMAQQILGMEVRPEATALLQSALFAQSGVHYDVVASFT